MIVAELPGRLLVTDLDEFRDRYRIARMLASQRAQWCADDPGAPMNTCRYCGRHWRKWVGSQLDGHAKCIVGEDFKAWLRDVMRDPRLTYNVVGRALELTPSVVRSWVVPLSEGKRTIEVRKR